VARESRYLFANLVSPLAGEKVTELLSADDLPMPAGHEAQHYEQYLLTAAQTGRRQRLARARGVPSILVTAIPKSASEFFSYTLAEVTGAAVGRVSIGDPLLGTLCVRWVKAALSGGCVTHDHFAASELNLSAMRAAGAERLTVLVRDPRAVYWSLECMGAHWYKVAPESCLDRDRSSRDVRVLSSWIDAWIRAKKNGFPVTFVRFKELTANPVGVLGDVLRSAGASNFLPRLHKVLQKRRAGRRPSSNFRCGDDAAWRAHADDEVRAALWDVISAEVRELLDLAP
jgi:hypothetical protein